MRRVYFDNAATTALDEEVLEAMLPFMKNHFGNPSSTHAHGRETRAAVEEARKKVAQLLNVSTSEIFFTSGGTEADNTALRCAVHHAGVTHIITSPIEHHAVLHTAKDLAHSGACSLSFVKIKPDGHVDIESLEALLKVHSNEKKLVSLMHANNELGNLLDINQVSALCKQYNTLFHSDTVQTVGHYLLDLQEVDIDFIAAAAHKFNGPKGVGFLYINKRTKIAPLITGGSQERNMRGGTENVYGIVGLAKALELSCANYHQYSKSISDVKNYMIERLKEIDGITFNGDYHNQSLYTVLNVSFPPSPISEMLLFKLDIEGISASGGSACSSGSNVGSHVLAALNLDARRANVRFSFDKNSSKDEVDFVLDKLKQMYALEIVANG
jgi:cysteine desulfurase